MTDRELFNRLRDILGKLTVELMDLVTEYGATKVLETAKIQAEARARKRGPGRPKKGE